MEPERARDRAREDDGPVSRLPPWLRRLGIAGFLFFLIKGLLWLLVPALLVGSRWLAE